MLAKQRDQSVYRNNITSKTVNLFYLVDGEDKSSSCCVISIEMNHLQKKDAHQPVTRSCI
jgi:hypothetical protein